MDRIEPDRAGLPVAEALPALRAALDAGRNVLLVAPPGAGKTTLAPLALLDAPWRRGRIVMLEPRRLATRAAAMRMAALLGEAVGGRVGYRTRLDASVSEATVIEVVTEGLLLRRLLADPILSDTDAVILDEVHERGLDGDLALALCRELQRQLRPELRLLAMSATPDQVRLASLLDAEVVSSAGRLHPVAVRHAARDLSQARDLPDAMARAVRDALAGEQGDVLAFLPGMPEIRRTEAALAGCGAAVLPLHGELPPATQDRALRPDPDGRRVVLATAIAETSLTVPGVRVVIDGGFRRTPRFDPGSGLSRLATVRISRAAADQRAGRAGREAPGVAIRLWTTALQRGLPPHDRPEILEADLAPLLLACLAWGAAPAALPFPDMPPAGALAAASALLEALGALDGATLTAFGRRMAAMGAHPRLAAMMLSAPSAGEQALAAALAALLEERDPLRDAGADLAARLAAIGGRATVGADRAALARIGRAAGQYRRRLGIPAATAPAGQAATLIAAAFPDRIAQARGGAGEFRLAGGGGARLPPTDPLARARLLAVAGMEQKGAARIRLAAPLDPDALPASVAARVTETVETAFDAAGGRVLARRRRRLGALTLDDRTIEADPAETATLLARALGARPAAWPWDDASRQLQARVATMRGLEPDAWPDFSDAALAAEAETLLAPHLLGRSRLDEAASLDLSAILVARLGRAAAGRLDRALPPALILPRGRAPIDYTGPAPVASARAQLFYGETAVPPLADGRVALRIALLSPAGRPIAVTADLGAFWRGGWAEARRDMRGRYPKHDWPEHPG